MKLDAAATSASSTAGSTTEHERNPLCESHPPDDLSTRPTICVPSAACPPTIIWPVPSRHAMYCRECMYGQSWAGGSKAIVLGAVNAWPCQPGSHLPKSDNPCFDKWQRHPWDERAVDQAE